MEATIYRVDTKQEIDVGRFVSSPQRRADQKTVYRRAACYQYAYVVSFRVVPVQLTMLSVNFHLATL